jgi:hypothetical protein
MSDLLGFISRLKQRFDGVSLGLSGLKSTRFRRLVDRPEVDDLSAYNRGKSPTLGSTLIPDDSSLHIPDVFNLAEGANRSIVDTTSTEQRVELRGTGTGGRIILLGDGTEIEVHSEHNEWFEVPEDQEYVFGFVADNYLLSPDYRQEVGRIVALDVLRRWSHCDMPILIKG